MIALNPNRLYHVNEAAAVSAYDDDIEDQGSFYLTDGTNHVNEDNNYIYTAIGELKVDVSEEIEEIVWRVDSKIAEVQRLILWLSNHKQQVDIKKRRLSIRIDSILESF